LDAFELADGTQHTACCVIENTPVQELSMLPSLRQLHENLIKNLALKNWNFCEQALEHLHGTFNGTLNSFYDHISNRIAKYKDTDPGPDWNGVYEKYNSGN
jgi:hypothetical protein